MAAGGGQGTVTTTPSPAGAPGGCGNTPNPARIAIGRGGCRRSDLSWRAPRTTAGPRAGPCSCFFLSATALHDEEKPPALAAGLWDVGTVSCLVLPAISHWTTSDQCNNPPFPPNPPPWVKKSNQERVQALPASVLTGAYQGPRRGGPGAVGLPCPPRGSRGSGAPLPTHTHRWSPAG